MNIADPLSRLCIISDCKKTNDDEHVNQIVENAKPCAISLTEIKMHSEQDSEILELPIPPAPMKRRELLDAPWVDIAMDLLGPLPSNDYLLVVVDYYSRHKEVKITKTITSCNNQAIERNIWQPRENTNKIVLQKTELRGKNKEQKERGKEHGDKRRKAQNVDLSGGDRVYVNQMSQACPKL
ncbi:unnamed protein product [Leptosia nina]|uniref:Uncharacterized protein n=1 Tax=Leptosia nina TaxID=320188 RepID=A0AAV1J531_9NEOP